MIGRGTGVIALASAAATMMKCGGAVLGAFGLCGYHAEERRIVRVILNVQFGTAQFW